MGFPMSFVLKIFKMMTLDNIFTNFTKITQQVSIKMAATFGRKIGNSHGI